MVLTTNRDRNRSNYARKPRAASVGDGAAEIHWVPNAPSELVIQHGNTRQGREVLGRLLKDPRMNRPWQQISKRIARRREVGGMSSRETYDRLWQAISSALAQTKRDMKPSARAAQQKKCRKIKRMALRLAAEITDSRLDVCVHHLHLWPNVDRGVRGGGEDWTPLQELLGKLALMAHAQATSSRVVQRVTAKTESNYFMRKLEPYFTRHLGDPMGVALAAIANVVLGTKASAQLTDEDVKRALRHQKRVN